MPRTKAFDVTEALEKAKDYFWAHGYQSTSMDDLLKAMGINRGSFYDTYENKHKLLLDALDHYIEIDIAPSIAKATEGLPPRDAILAIFKRKLQKLNDPKGRFGCFLINTALELAPHDEEVAKVVHRRYDELAKMFIRLVKQAQAEGTISTRCKPTQLGRLLLNHFLGLLVMLRSRVSETMLKSVVNQVDLLLD
jgi:TetR/AcrR family transcriptional repressor of nem operon